MGQAFNTVLGASLIRSAAPGMKTASVPDPHFNNTTAGNLTMPADWDFSGVILRATPCIGGRPQPFGVYRTQSKDGLTGVQYFPHYAWIEAETPQATQRFGGLRCPVYGDISIKDLGRSIASGRPNARIVEVAGPVDGNFAANLKARQEQEQSATPPSLHNIFPPPVSRGEQGHLRIAYTLNGHPVEEWIVINKIVTRNLYTACVDNMGHPTRFNWVDYYTVEAFGLRAPQGKLDAEFPHLLTIRRSAQPASDWAQRESNEQFAFDQHTIAQTNKSMQANYEALNRQSMEIVRGALANEDAALRHGADVVDMLAGRQFTRNEQTGQTGYVPLSQERSYQNANTGTVVSSSDVNFNPNEPGQNWTDPGDWNRLRPITH